MKRIFFYGLFMDANLLRESGLHPKVIGPAELPDFKIFIGNRATLMPSQGARSYGVVMELSDDETASLYSGQDVRDYRPESVVTILIDGRSVQESLCYNLPLDATGSEANVQYAEKLASLVLELGFSPAYADEISKQYDAGR